MTIPSSVNIVINGNDHLFERRLKHNRNAIDMEQWDQYIFREDGVTNLCLELKVNYYRYFDEKALFEVYFELLPPMGCSQQFQRLVCPTYFYEKFITDDDYQHYSDSIYKWTGLIFVNTRIGYYDFLDFKIGSLSRNKERFIL